MTRTTTARSALSGMAAAVLLLLGLMTTGLGSDAGEDHPVLGRFSVTSEAGGAIWAFQPSGKLVVTGPGDIVSLGTWVPAAGEGEFDAKVDVAVTGQVLEVLGQVSPEALEIALWVAATEATKADDWTPWPAESRLTGGRLGMMSEATPSPTPQPLDCARPEWVDGSVDWDRCDNVPTPA